VSATVAIMGDRFMLSEIFETAIRARCVGSSPRC